MYDCTVHLIINKWDTDGEKIKLPKKMKLVVSVDDDTSIDEIHDEAMGKASDETGWCIDSSTIDRIHFNK